jgi:hypothetical protein
MVACDEESFVRGGKTPSLNNPDADVSNSGTGTGTL